MTYKRSISLDPVKIDRWRWSPFLDLLNNYFVDDEINSYGIEEQFLNKEKYVGSSKRLEKVHLATWGFRSKKIRKGRAACLQFGMNISVLNLVLSPYSHYDLPFFGADFVTLKNGHLIALDLQPVLKDDICHTRNVWNKLVPIHDKWQALLPSGGNIPEDAKTYFSPGFLWSRIKLGADGDAIISKYVYGAFNDYLELYLNLLAETKEVDQVRAFDLLKGQKNYMKYRAKKDPARGLLKSFFGPNWTDSYINDVLFDLQ